MSSSQVIDEPLSVRVYAPTRRWGGRLPATVGALGAGLVLAAILWEGGRVERLAAPWLMAVLFYTSIGVGSLFFVLVQFASRAGWSVVVRRMAENLMATLPLLGLLFLPVLFSLPSVYEWAREGAGADALLRHKSPWLNEPFFILRSLVYFALWSGMAWWFRRESIRQDRTGAHAITRRLQAVSGPALIVYALTITFAAFDWMMSLQPRWYSTIFGVYWFAGCVIAAFASMALLAEALRSAGTLQRVFTAEHRHDVGKLLFAFVAFWSYVAFSQYFLIWYAGLPEETHFFVVRWHGTWRYASLLIGLGHFVAPFFFLLPRAAKRRTGPLVAASAWMLLMQYLDLAWLIGPVFRPDGVAFTFADGALLLGFGGLFIAATTWLSSRSALIPIRDPRLPESISFENI